MVYDRTPLPVTPSQDLTETIWLEGEQVLTLRELVSPKVHTVIVGINPPPPAVKAGHYYQGRLGRQLWRCMRLAGIGSLRESDRGLEDSILFAQGFGFLDLVRRPTPRASDLTRIEWRNGAKSLISRIVALDQKPRVIFVYKSVADLVKDPIQALDFRTFTIGCTGRQFREDRFHEMAEWLKQTPWPISSPGEL